MYCLTGGLWVYVCGRSWNQRVAQAACNQLGLPTKGTFFSLSYNEMIHFFTAADPKFESTFKYHFYDHPDRIPSIYTIQSETCGASSSSLKMCVQWYEHIYYCYPRNIVPGYPGVGAYAIAYLKCEEGKFIN